MESLSSALSPPVNPHRPVVFEEFFELGQQESVSPFLTPDSRAWAANLALKASIVAAVLLLISFILSRFTPLLPASHFTLILVYFLAGIPSLIESIEDLSQGEINIDVLMTLAAFSSILIGSGLEGGLLLVLFSLSGAMENAVETKAKGSISSLHKLSPTKATVVMADGTLLEKSLNDIKVDTKILIKSSQVVPLDGVVVEGISSVNMVHLTGENLPVTKKVGDNVAAGSRNLEGALTVAVTHTSSDSTLARIIQLVTEAQEARPALQRWFDKLSKGYAITIILLALFFSLALPFLLNIPYLGVEGSVYRSVAFLIAASPCALIIAIPIAYLSALSVCARKGILLKGGIVLDALASCTAIAFDKTGTITTGALSFAGIAPLDSASADEIAQAMSIAYSLERNAVHPIAQAISNAGQAKKLPLTPLVAFKAVPGYGLSAQAEGKEVYIGSPDYIKERLSPDQTLRLQNKIDAFKAAGELIAVMHWKGNVYIFRFTDTPRSNVKSTIAALKNKWRWRVVMLTGDHLSNAERIAKEVGIDEVHADLKPEDKLHYVAKLSEQGLAMIGDGINDAPALARSTVGICMGKVGSTAAVDASDIILLRDNIELMDWLVGKAYQTQSIVKQNLTLAISAILIAALPALGGIVPLWLAVVMHEGGTVLVGLNALRLLRT